MSGSLIAVARTPWAPRHTTLDGRRPEALLEAALRGLAHRADIDPNEIDRILVGCDTPVGAQALNVGRRAALQAGWTTTPALTVDGHGASGLALVGLAAALPGTTVVAGVDASSMVPPGAGLVRDYGRPTLDQPEHHWLDSVALVHDLDGPGLDGTVAAAQDRPVLTSPAIVEFGPNGPSQDAAVYQEVGEPFQLGGIVAPHHVAPWADGAVAVLIGGASGRTIDTSTFDAMTDDELIARLIAPGDDARRLVVDNSAVIAALSIALPPEVPSPLAIGSAPSCDGLRALADAASNLDEAFEIVTRGGHGQIASVTVGPRRRTADPSKLDKAT